MTHKRRLTEDVAGNVRAEMARRRIGQPQIAQALGLSQASVSRRLMGQTPIDVNELEVIAQVLDVPISTLLPATAVPA